jgi:uncharacterized membrane protein YbaN (DUF454 family)
MGIIDEKIVAVSVIGVLYGISWLIKPQTILRVIINTVLGICTIIWALDFFGFYPISKIIPVNLYS